MRRGILYIIAVLYVSGANYCLASGNYYSYGAGKERIDGSGTIHYYVDDQVDSARVILKEDQTIEWSSDYQPYGREVNLQAMGVAEDKTFSGKEHDQTGLYYFGARYYDPATGRFYSVDPEGDGYVYVENNPLRFIDPDGRDIAPHTLAGPSGMPSPEPRCNDFHCWAASGMILNNTMLLVSPDASTGSQIFWGALTLFGWNAIIAVPKLAYAARPASGAVGGIPIHELKGLIDVFFSGEHNYTVIEFAKFAGIKSSQMYRGLITYPELGKAWAMARSVKGLPPPTMMGGLAFQKAPDVIRIVTKEGFTVELDPFPILNRYYEQSRALTAGKFRSSKGVKEALQKLNESFNNELKRRRFPYTIDEMKKMYSPKRTATALRGDKYKDIGKKYSMPYIEKTKPRKGR